MKYKNIAFVASHSTQGQRVLTEMEHHYGNSDLHQADVVVVLGGDGFMLETLHKQSEEKPLFGMKAGTIGFLMNRYRTDHLRERLQIAQITQLKPLCMRATTSSGQIYTRLAYNEVSLLRQSKQTAKLRIYLQDSIKLDELIGDGILISTPAGSTAYNLSANGPILPLDSKVLALTPLAPFRPRRWRGAIIPTESTVRIDILEHYKRPVSVTADAHEIRDIISVTVSEINTHTATLLFDPEHNLAERILNEQFTI